MKRSWPRRRRSSRQPANAPAKAPRRNVRREPLPQPGPRARRKQQPGKLRRSALLPPVQVKNPEQPRKSVMPTPKPASLKRNRVASLRPVAADADDAGPARTNNPQARRPNRTAPYHLTESTTRSNSSLISKRRKKSKLRRYRHLNRSRSHGHVHAISAGISAVIAASAANGTSRRLPIS